MSQDRIHIKPIESHHHHKVGSSMGTTFKKGHKLGEIRIKKEEIDED
jgi:dihydrodipicolinate reductase